MARLREVMSMQDSDNKDKTSGNDDWMFDNPFMNKVATKGGWL